jgi:hypothetical protein
MDLHLCYNASEDTFPLPLQIKQLYGPFGFPTRSDTQRPYISSNFVMGLDGRASFTELKGRAGGKEVSRSKEDRWLMDFLRAHHDGQLIGAGRSYICAQHEGVLHSLTSFARVRRSRITYPISKGSRLLSSHVRTSRKEKGLEAEA